MLKVEPNSQSSLGAFAGLGLRAAGAEEPDPVEGRVVEARVAAGLAVAQNNLSGEEEHHGHVRLLSLTKSKSGY